MKATSRIAAAFILVGGLGLAGGGVGAWTSSNHPQRAARTVVINGQRLSDDEIDAAEKRRVRLMDGKYWYDRLTGAWGPEGGPCAGFVTAGLKLGGPLRADASKGNTGVFINGRQLHVLDVVRLRQVIPVYPGRYWANAESTFGYEGGPAIGNIWLAVIGAMRGGSGGGGPVKREGILSTYDKTGVAVFGY